MTSAWAAVYVHLLLQFFGHPHVTRTPRGPAGLKAPVLAGACDGTSTLGRLKNGFSHAAQREASASFSSVQALQTLAGGESMMPRGFVTTSKLCCSFVATSQLCCSSVSLCRGHVVI